MNTDDRETQDNITPDSQPLNTSIAPVLVDSEEIHDSDLNQQPSPKLPHKSRRNKLTVVLVIVGLVGLVGIGFAISVIISLEGGFEGIKHNTRRLPDFKSGKPAANRTLYKQEIEALDRELTAITEKQYEMSFQDYCERSQYNIKVKSDHLSYCDRSYDKLYLTNIDVCEILPVLNTLIDAEFTNDGGCTAQNPNGNYNDVSKYAHEGSLDYITIAAIDRQTALNGVGLNIIKDVYSGGYCKTLNYCEFAQGNYDTWQDLLQHETYSTVILLESRRTYYKE